MRVLGVRHWLNARHLAQLGLIALILAEARTFFEILRVPAETAVLAHAGMLFAGFLLAALIASFYQRWRISGAISLVGVLFMIGYKVFAGLA